MWTVFKDWFWVTFALLSGATGFLIFVSVILAPFVLAAIVLMLAYSWIF